MHNLAHRNSGGNKSIDIKKNTFFFLFSFHPELDLKSISVQGTEEIVQVNAIVQFVICSSISYFLAALDEFLSTSNHPGITIHQKSIHNLTESYNKWMGRNRMFLKWSFSNSWNEENHEQSQHLLVMILGAFGNF